MKLQDNFQDLSNSFKNFTGLALERGNPENFDLFFQYIKALYSEDNVKLLFKQNILIDEIFDYIKSIK